MDTRYICNIQVFNGDSRNVTLFGESAGAASVHLHMLSKHANKLFYKCIMQSGTANMEWVFQSNPEYKAQRLAEVMGYRANGTRGHLLNFLQSSKVKPLDIMSKTLLVMTSDERRCCLPLPFTPVMLKQSNTIEIPSIMGYNSAEGLAMMVHALIKLEEIDIDFHRLVPRNIPLEPQNEEQKWIAKKIREFYLNGESITPKLFNNLTNILSDYHFVIDMQNAVEWHAKFQPKAPLYFYRFEYVGDRNMYKSIFKMQKLAGACHGDELFYLFQMADDSTDVSERDQQLISQISNLWANFAKYSNPTPKDQNRLINCDWSTVKIPEGGEFTLDYLAIGNNGFQMKTNPDRERKEFWQNIYTLYEPIDLSRLNSKL